MDINKLVEIIMKRLTENSRLTVAVDGRCASGKTTLTNQLSRSFDCDVIHIDDFFLRPEQRTESRLTTPGGNFDRERFIDEVVTGIKSGDDFTYRKFNCTKMALDEKITVQKKPLLIIEGSYSCHPDIAENWDIKIFVTTDTKTQKERIGIRNPDKADTFFNKWIPLEEKYFEHFNIEDNSDCIIKT